MDFNLSDEHRMIHDYGSKIAANMAARIGDSRPPARASQMSYGNRSARMASSVCWCQRRMAAPGLASLKWRC